MSGAASGGKSFRRVRLNEHIFISGGEAGRLLEGARSLGLEWLVPLYVIRSLGLRVTEAIHIRVRDIRIDLGKIFVWTAKAKSGAEPVGCSCNGFKGNVAVKDTLPLKPTLVQVLAGWVEYKSLSPDDWLFPSRRWRLKHLTRQRISQVFGEASIAGTVTKVERRGLHSLRHLVGTEVAQETGSPYAVQRVLRQSNIASGESYVHVRNLEEIMNKIGEKDLRGE